MVHSVELLFDAGTDAAVREVWAELTAAGIRSQAGHTSPTNRPHVTLTVAEHLDDDVDASLRPLLAALPLRCVIGAPTMFGGGRAVTLVRLMVPSSGLLTLHSEVHRVCLPHTPDGPLPHAAPGQWTPHVTLARRVRPDQLERVVGVRGVFRDIPATAVALRHWDGNRRIEHPID